ncbi:MAG: class I SAM-dependent methyltransferase [bacterium]
MKNSRCCRFCSAELKHTLVDLGLSPLSNAYLTAERLREGEMFFPLHVWVCDSCFLAQLEEFSSPKDIFSDYAYFSSFSESWLEHARRYVEEMSAERKLDANSLVVEIASNDGYLLQYFVKKGVPVLGVEPAANVAAEARKKGVRSEVAFFGKATAEQLSQQYGKARLLLGNNVLAHVPDINDFIAGLKIMLHEEGLLTMEFPSLLNLLQLNQFDTIYHEHFSYLSLSVVKRMFEKHGLTVHDVRELPTHGGSLRVYASHKERQPAETDRLRSVLEKEKKAGLLGLQAYQNFEKNVLKIKIDLLEFLIRARKEGKKVAGYGAAAKGNTLLNYAGIKPDLLSYVVDRSPHKQGKYLPGSRIPIFAPERFQEDKPDYVLILPWNLKGEICLQMDLIRKWGGRFVVSIPQVSILP